MSHMKFSRYTSSRQKSCQQCSDSKSRCDRKQGRCTRCTQRGLSCIYPGLNVPEDVRLSSTMNDTGCFVSALKTGAPYPSSNSDLSINAESSNPTVPEGVIDTQTIVNEAGSNTPSVLPVYIRETRVPDQVGSCAPGEPPEKPDVLDFSRLDPICPINVNNIRNRWLNPYIHGVEQEIKEYPAAVNDFIYRVLKSYAAVAARGRDTLPFIHPTQIKASDSSLATCLSLVRISENPVPGSEATAAIILQREMESIAKVHDDYDDMSLLAAFQAYLIYTVVLFFRLNQGSNPFFRSAMMNLQELACSSSRRGLICSTDATHTRPRWEEWIAAKAKRRTFGPRELPYFPRHGTTWSFCTIK